MNLSRDQLSGALSEFVPTLTDVLAKCLQSCADKERSGQVAMVIKCQVNKEKTQLTATAVVKCREPKGYRIDIVAGSDDEEIGSWTINEAPGQQEIGQ